MKTQYRILTLLVLAVLIIPAATLPLTAAATATFNLDTTTGSAGTVTTATSHGSGWKVGDTITLTWDNPSTVLKTTTSHGGNPRWSTSITIPATAALGDHTVTATDQHGKTATATFTVNVPAVTMRVSYQVSDSTTPPQTPVFHYRDTVGTNKTYQLTTSAHSLTVGAGLQWTVGTPIGSGGERWTTTNASGNAPSSGSATVVFTYHHQYLLTVNSAYDSPTGAGWYNASSTATFAVTSPSEVNSTVQNVFVSWSGSGTGAYSGTSISRTVTMNGPITETANWKTQYKVTFEVNPSGAGTTTPSPSAWYDAGASLSPISAAAADGYCFDSWTKTGDVAIADADSSSTNFNLTGPGTIITNFLMGEIQQIDTQISLQYTPPQQEAQQGMLSGRLTLANDNLVGIADKQVILSYFDGVEWHTITTVTTGADGSYSYDWTLPQGGAAGVLQVKASFEGDPEGTSPQYQACSSTAVGNNIQVLPEYSLGGLVAFAACFIGFAVFKLRKNHNSPVQSRLL